MIRFFCKNKKGFSLIEVLVATGIFVIFAMGIYSGIQFVFKVVYNSRVRIIETSLLNEQIEIIRNVAFSNIGIINGSPAGVFDRIVSTTRNGIDFTITRTVRNIDDPYDGVIGTGQEGGGECQDPKIEVCHSNNTLCIADNALPGHLEHGDTEGACGGSPAPNDNQPADYKFVEVSVLCDHCRQNNPVSLSTIVAPKFLEGDPTHGALFVEVFDSNADPVQGADVHIVATDTDPTVDFTDTTDNDGMLRIVDLGSGINSYQITVSKIGYTTDMTINTSEAIPNPIKPFASVVAQDVTEISFSIDKVAGIDLSTIDLSCQPVGTVSVGVSGTHFWGTNPTVLKVDESIVTNGTGNYTMNNLAGDNYSFSTPSFDIIGTIPVQPINLLADTTQPVQLILGTKSTNALNVAVLDDATDQPIANANIHLTSAFGFDDTVVTGVGSIRQTDWSGGGGQSTMSDNTKFALTDGNLDFTGSPGDVTLEIVGQYYASSGWLESSTFDLGAEPTYRNIIWEPLAQPTETGDDSVKFQVASTSTTDAGSWSYLGPDGTTNTYYTTSNLVLNEIHNGDQYMRYRVYLSTVSSTYTPTLSDVSLTYTNSCTPPGQAYFANLANATYDYTITASGYENISGSVDVSGYTLEEVRMSSE